MLSIEKCRKVLNNKEQRYTEIEINQIREILYKLAFIEYNNHKRNYESGNLLQGIDRRTKKARI